MDLSIVRKHAHYDKLGNELLLKCFKVFYFGSRDTRLMTRKRCEAFFDEPTNFDLAALIQKTSKEPRKVGTLAGLFVG